MENLFRQRLGWSGVSWFWLVWCELLQVTTSYYGLLRVGAGWCELVLVGAG